MARADSEINNGQALQIITEDVSLPIETGSYVDELYRPMLRRVPASLHSVNPQAFLPVTVAIGPLHRHLINEGLYAYSFLEMERCKKIAAHAISSHLRASGLMTGSIDIHTNIIAALSRAMFVTGVENCTTSVKRCYSPDFGLDDMDTETLVSMFTLDACFIVEMMRCLYRTVNGDSDPSMRITSNKGNEFSRAFESMAYPTRKAVVLDLLLMDNQVPLFLVKQVMAVDGRHIVVHSAGDSCSLAEEDVERRLEKMIGSIARKVLPFCKSVPAASTEVSRAENLLDCLYKIVTVGSDSDFDYDSSNSANNNTKNSVGAMACLPSYKSAGFYHQAVIATKHVEVPTATVLRRAGVKFLGHHGSLRHVSMHRNMLTLPVIHVGDETEKIFRNLLAHETQTYRSSVVVLSYLHFMNSLINTADDVALLVEAGVVTESIGDHKRVAQMWNRLATNTPCVHTGAYRTVAQAARSYVDDSVHVYVYEFVERYLSRPWLAVSLMSGIALLVMTFLITYFTIKLYLYEATKL